jgi:hypothetical protein
MRYRPGYPLELPVCFINEELCEPIKRGGMLVSINRRVRVKCDGETIPEMLTVDLTDLRAGTVIKLDRVKFPKGVVPHEVGRMCGNVQALSCLFALVKSQ